jgi:hypothetical protein
MSTTCNRRGQPGQDSQNRTRQLGHLLVKHLTKLKKAAYSNATRFSTERTVFTRHFFSLHATETGLLKILFSGWTDFEEKKH